MIDKKNSPEFERERFTSIFIFKKAKCHEVLQNILLSAQRRYCIIAHYTNCLYISRI